MTLRSVLNAAWVLACDGLDAKGIEELRDWLYKPVVTAEQEAEEERKRKARENRESIANLGQAFSLGR